MLEITKSSNYMKPVILIKSNNSEVLTSNSLCLIKGEVGSGKSRLVMNIMVGLSGITEDLNLEYSPCPEGKHVIYLSTEMSPYHLQKRLLKVLSVTGDDYENKLKFFDINGVTDIKTEVKNILNKYPPYVIIIDQIGDFVQDINDVKSCKNLSMYLNQIIREYQTSIIVIMHQNEDSGINTKARGHLGSELEQKSVCSIAIANTVKGFKIKTTKMREGINIIMDAEFNQQTEMLKQVIIPSQATVTNSLTFPLDATSLVQAYMKQYNKSESYVRKIIKDQVSKGILTTSKQGKEVYYNKQ